MSKKQESKILQALNFVYDCSVTGLPGQSSAAELAEEYLKNSDSIEDAIASLIRWQMAKSGAIGFVNGLPGIALLPVTVPADFISTYLIHVRMVAAIAHMNGHDLRSDKTRTAVFITLLGDSAREALAKAGVELSKRASKVAISKLPGTVILKINQAVGFRLATKAGEKGILNVAKIVPIVGGIVGGSVNAYSTHVIGNTAAKFLKAA